MRERSQEPRRHEAAEDVDGGEDDVEVGAGRLHPGHRLVDVVEALHLDAEATRRVGAFEALEHARRQVLLPLVDAQDRVALDRQVGRDGEVLVQRQGAEPGRRRHGRLLARRQRGGDRSGEGRGADETEEAPATEAARQPESMVPSCHSGSSSRRARYST